MRLLQTNQPGFKKRFQLILERSQGSSSSVVPAVQKIVDSVRRRGDQAVRSTTRKFDKYSPSHLKVTPSEIREAYKKIEPAAYQSLQLAARRIKKFHQHQKRREISSWRKKDGGITLGEQVRPLNRIGIYVPGGLAGYPSSVLMNAIPAQVAGVREIIMVSPWFKGVINPYTLVAADLVGINKIFKVGGAQAIAALAYGTKSIPAVDKIVGPGNLYVATAKRLLFGQVGIDMIAGPSEVLILADETANPNHLASDLLSQAEHDPQALPLLITTSKQVARETIASLRRKMKEADRQSILRQSLKNRGVIIVAKNRAELVNLANQIGAEHLQLQTRNPQNLLPKIENAGAIFLGPFSPVAFGDYIVGPNHVLPTAGSSRFSSPLGVGDFLKRSSLIDVQPSAFRRLADDVIRLANLEGLFAHADSVEVRRKS